MRTPSAGGIIPGDDLERGSGAWRGISTWFCAGGGVVGTEGAAGGRFGGVREVEGGGEGGVIG